MNYKNTYLVPVIAAVGMIYIPSLQANTSWMMATGYPDNSFFTQNLREFVEEVEEKSDGRITIDMRSNGTLVSHDEIKRSVQRGVVQLGEIRLGAYSNEHPVFRIDSLPGLATTYEEGYRLNELLQPYYEEVMAEQGILPLAYVSWPGQGFFADKPIESTDDTDGMSIRIYSQPTQQMAQELGFNATILPFSEVPQAFSTNMIDSLFTSAQTGIDVQVWDYADYFTYTGTMHNINALIINPSAFDTLDDELQQVVRDAARNAHERGWEMSQARSTENQGVLEEHGVTVTQATDELQAAINDVGETILAKWREDASDEANQIVDAYVEWRDSAE
ncbi:TRAP transporter substrate-binding protein [Halomonas sp. IOP_14]|uniref:TRAP transporter substrate-binding protein n=1 Tax=Halomonadaceae TaxID=28256 RepID=UPI0011447CD8|nr:MULTISPECIES: TRAP transporter substrate-binding protein [Halomonas]MCD1588911.1 TRAP transporter substrate-binding protein [Halomonas sp. IOP_14]